MMASSEIVTSAKRICEYRSIVRHFDRAGMFELLERAHSTPMEIEAARALVESHGIECRITRRTKRGRAYPPKAGRKRYAVTLPLEPGIGYKRLRVGIVLHEIAHVLDHRRRCAEFPRVSVMGGPFRGRVSDHVKMNHAIGFRKRFAELLRQWGAA